MENPLNELKSQVRQVKITLWLIIGSVVLIIAIGATLMVPEIFKVEYNGTTRLQIDDKGTMTINADSTSSDVALKILSASSSRGDMKFSVRTTDPTTPGAGDLWYNSSENRYKLYDGTFKRYVFFDLTQDVRDATTNANHGTRGANSSAGSDDPTWTTDAKLGESALLLDGSNDFVCTNATNQFNTSSGTVEAWVKLIALPPDPGNYTFASTGPSDESSGWKFEYYNVAGVYSMSFRKWTPEAYQLINYTLPLTWTHVAVTWNATTTTIYVNGSSIGSYAQTSPTAGTTKLYIGADGRGGGGSQLFSGSMDEVAIWNVALSPAQISARWNGGAGAELVGNEAGLVSVWHMNDPK